LYLVVVLVWFWFCYCLFWFGLLLFRSLLTVRYNQLVPGIVLSGPTSFAPLIYETIRLVKEAGGYHILLIVADGQVTNEKVNARAIVEVRMRMRMRMLSSFLLSSLLLWMRCLCSERAGLQVSDLDHLRGRGRWAMGHDGQVRRRAAAEEVRQLPVCALQRDHDQGYAVRFILFF
jgi:hypothetical protein